MLHIKPLNDAEVPADTRALYGRIRQSFKLDTTPLFFTYMGNYPEFLEYIWRFMEENLKIQEFWDLAGQCSSASAELFKEAYTPSVTAKALVTQLFENNATRDFVVNKFETLAVTNATIALIFVAIRESIKGWALSTNLLNDKYDSASFDRVTRIVEQEVENSMVSASSSIEQAEHTLYFDYLRCMAIVQSEVDDSVKHESHLVARLKLEEYLLDHISTIPRSIDISYPILAQYASNYRYFDELVYLLSESFPTISANRVIASSIAEVLLGTGELAVVHK